MAAAVISCRNVYSPASASACVGLCMCVAGEIMQASNNAQIEPPQKAAQGQAERRGIGVESGGRERITDHDKLAHILQTAGPNAPLPAKTARLKLFVL